MPDLVGRGPAASGFPPVRDEALHRGDLHREEAELGSEMAGEAGARDRGAVVGPGERHLIGALIVGPGTEPGGNGHVLHVVPSEEPGQLACG